MGGVGIGVGPTRDERHAYKARVAGLNGASDRRALAQRLLKAQVLFASTRLRRCARLDTPGEANVLEDARDDARLGDGGNELQFAAAYRAPAQSSMANTRCNRAIQRIGVVHVLGWVSSSVVGLLATLGRATTCARSRALGVNRPWYLTRWALGRGTSAASRAQ